MTKINDNKNPGKTPNSLTIMPDNQAPISLYKFVGVLSETTPQPLSVELKVSIIAISDIEKNNSRVDRIFFIIPITTKFPSISWSFLTIKKFPIVKIIEFFSLSLQLHLCYQLKKFLKIHYQD